MWFFLFSMHVLPRRAFFNFRRFARMHYSEHRSLENTCPEVHVFNCFVSEFTRICCFFKNVKNHLLHGNVDKCFKIIAKLSKTCKKIHFFSVFGARGPPESDFHFQGLCIMPLQGRDSSRKNTFKPIDSEHFCVRIQSSFPVWVKNYKLSILCKLLEKDFAKTENQAGLKASCSSVLSFLCEKSFSNAPLPSVS